MKADVVVVGGGIAGMSAAVRALEEGASVILLERANAAERGGNTRYTESYWRMRSPDAVSEDFETRLAANAAAHADPALIHEMREPYSEWSALARAAPFVDPELIAMLAAEAPAAVQWLQEMGVRFDFLPNYFIAQSTTRMAPVGGGLALLDALFARAETFGTQLTTLLETTARALRFDDGKVAGVTAVDADHTVINIDAGVPPPKHMLQQRTEKMRRINQPQILDNEQTTPELAPASGGGDVISSDVGSNDARSCSEAS